MSIRAWRNDKEGVFAWEEVGNIMSPNIGLIESIKPHHFTSLDIWSPSSELEKRIKGQYHFETATGELTYGFNGRYDGYKLELRFEKLEDGQKLYTLIRAGKIAPVISYEEAQHATTIRHLADLWREFVLLVRTTVSNRIHRLRQA